MPKRGSAVWWPHGLEDNPWKKDDRTHHEAMPVLQGVKMAANYWIHVDDFKQAMALGCDGRQGQPRRIWRKGCRLRAGRTHACTRAIVVCVKSSLVEGVSR